MHYLCALGFLVFLAVPGSTLEHELSTEHPNGDKPSIGTLEMPSRPEAEDPGFADWGSLHPLGRHPRSDGQSFTPFEKRVIRILRKHGLLKSEAEKAVEELEKNKDLLRKLKELLNEVDKEHETDDFYDDFWGLILS
ncbi:uncharacterized protein LOC108023366 [Drosophila biarmipes]|uniref:uncharacterized protein LOC108023366 n=1 Tax=Drosophila biarmipes TaxID=125945 RepID=UPI0007E7F42D|nr:uncharacterized protein LOC108023366 [Drosophila biarmipes]